MTNEQLWEATLGELELVLSKSSFNAWLDGTFIYKNENNNIAVGVPSDFHRHWIEAHCHQSILKALRRVSDEDIKTVTYQVATKNKKFIAETTRETPPAQHTTTPVQEPSSEAVRAVAQANDMPMSDFGLNPRYTFENFVVGKKNELAHAACLAVAENPGLVYNPLFIYGGVGLGKTHLMQAVGNTALKKNSRTKILYVSCETFTNEFIRSVGEGRAEQFKDKYRSVDILMVDDIQFLAGKEGTQEAFFHTFNHLHQNNKQVILTSDRPPRAIPTLEHRLISRFEGGMIVDVNIPDLETRIAILGQKCQEKNSPMNNEILQFIASSVQHNVRELEGALNRVIAWHQLNKTEPTLESVKQVLSSLSQTPKRGAVTTKKITSTVAEYFEIEQKDLTGNSRKKELVVPRQIAMFLMREEVHASYPNIGQELGGRDHTTAMHACQKIEQLKEEDEKISNDISLIKQRLYNS
ncbi:MAG: chromosomal replication initiator protein DnaA [Candidatus Kerfeldbacteria bacterium]|nr:chromosomal replication initiator protein DnaA [Candidatus Kerfeldbacteria bacterium]